MTDVEQVTTEYRRAARRILRSRSLDEEARAAALIRLYGRAKAEEFASLIVGAIVAEIGWDIDGPDVLEARGYGDRQEREHRRLRARGLDRCPECWSVLSGPADWDGWAALREAAVAEAAAKEGAA